MVNECKLHYYNGFRSGEADDQLLYPRSYVHNATFEEILQKRGHKSKGHRKKIKQQNKGKHHKDNDWTDPDYPMHKNFCDGLLRDFEGQFASYQRGVLSDVQLNHRACKRFGEYMSNRNYLTAHTHGKFGRVLHDLKHGACMTYPGGKKTHNHHKDEKPKLKHWEKKKADHWWARCHGKGIRDPRQCGKP